MAATRPGWKAAIIRSVGPLAKLWGDSVRITLFEHLFQGQLRADVDAALGREYHQMIGGYADSQNLAEGVVIMAGEQGFDGAAGGQLQAVEGGGAEEDLAGDGGSQRAAGLADNVVRTQQHVHCTARRQLIEIGRAHV